MNDGPSGLNGLPALPVDEQGANAAQDESYEKVENYLRACRIASRLQRARLTAIILQRATERVAKGGPDAARPMPELAIEEARAMVREWMDRILPPRIDDRAHTPSEGFVALYLSDAPARWPGAFLHPEETPPGFLDTLRARLVKAGPELEVSSIVPRSMDYGLPESARATLEQWPLVRALLTWLLLGAAMVALFWYTRQL